MRNMLIVFVFVLATAASAQQSAPSHGRPSPPPAPPPHTTAPRTVAPPIVFPLPSLPQQPAGGLTTPPAPFNFTNPTVPARDLYRVRPGAPYRTHAMPYGAGGYGYGADVGAYEPQAPTGTIETQPAGMMRLDVTPESAQVFVDSFYVGTVADIETRRVLTLAAGPHRVEIRAGDYEPAAFDVRIEPNDTITYRTALQPARPAAPVRPQAAAAAATKMYVIPNCYLGNVPPRADRLPRGCDVKQVHVVGGP
jgi:PEGA domain-containing protein